MRNSPGTRRRPRWLRPAAPRSPPGGHGGQAGQIFPAAAPYVNWDGLYTTGYRVGIARQASCEAAFDPPVAQILRRHGCAAVLRATYVNQSGSQVATVGVAVMPSLAAALAAVSSVASAPGQTAGLRAAGFPGTWSDRFGDAQRGWFGVSSSGPYAYFFAAGYTDGRPVPAGPAPTTWLVLGIWATACSTGSPPSSPAAARRATGRTSHAERPGGGGRGRVPRRPQRAGCTACGRHRRCPAGERPPGRRPGSPPGRAGFGAAASGQLVRELRGAWRITRGRGVTVAIVAQGVEPGRGGVRRAGDQRPLVREREP